MIPKRIIQIWGGGNALPLLCQASSANVRLLNPDFEYLLFDDDRINRFIRQQSPDYRLVLDSFRFPIQRYDFLRYLIIYRYGGFYFDMDVLLASGLSDLLNFDCVFPFERLTWSDYLRNECGMDWEIGNYAFGATAEHPFLGAVIENCLRAQKDKKWADAVTRSLPRLLQQELHVIYTTGPGLVSRTLAEFPDASNQVEVLFPENVWDKKNCWNLFGKYGVHLGGGSWRTHHGEWRRRIINYFGKRNEEHAIKYAQQMGKTRSLQFKKYNAL